MILHSPMLSVRKKITTLYTSAHRSAYVYRCSSRCTHKSFKRAFTVIELLVVVAIFAIIMSVALWNQKELSNNILITNLAYEIGLAVRETQAYGIGVRANSGAIAARDFRGGFGLYVNIANNNQLIVFSDLNDDGVYDNGTDPGIRDETFAVYKFQNQGGNKIKALCMDIAPGGSCSTANGKSEITIMFKRPNPEASFSAVAYESIVSTIHGGPAHIVINTPADNNCRAIVVEATGQIHIDNPKSGVPACINSN